MIEKNENIETLILEATPALARVVRSYFSQECDREDAFQEVVMRLIKKHNSWRGEAPFQHWACAIASRTCISILRANKLRRFLSLDFDVASKDTSDAEHNARGNELQQIVQHALSALPDRLRHVLALSMTTDQNDDDLANTLKTSVENVRVRRYRAREQLKTALKKQGYEHV